MRLIIAGVITLIIFIMMSALRIEIEAKKAGAEPSYSVPSYNNMPENRNIINLFPTHWYGLPDIIRHYKFPGVFIPLSGYENH